MKIKIYIVTYNNNKILNEWSLKTLFESDLSSKKYDIKVEINVINNHSNILIDDKFINKINILNNVLRPDFSTGHLARNWNQAIINGFKDIKNPDCDILVCCQNDTKFKKNWLEDLIELHKTFSFITQGQGDCFHSYTIDAIKNIGLWDERFCTICFQEHDYFLRALIYNKDFSSINSHHSKQLLNPINIELLEKTQCGAQRGEESHFISRQNIDICHHLFNAKWGVKHAQWNTDFKWVPSISKIQNFIYYPYFEKNILNLKEKNYLI